MRYLLLLVLLAACATPTPYQPMQKNGGFIDREVGQNKYLVTFRGNGKTAKQTAEDYAFRRAQELCVERGFKRFEMASKQDASTVRKAPSHIQCNNSGYVTTCNDYGGRVFELPAIELLITCAN